MASVSHKLPESAAARDFDELESLRAQPTEWGAFLHHGLESLRTTRELPKTGLWEYVEDRYAIDPSRFARYHPRLAKLLFEDECRIPSLPICPPSPECPAIPPSCTGTPAPPPTPPPVRCVPEPSSLILMAAGVIAIVRRRSFGR